MGPQATGESSWQDKRKTETKSECKRKKLAMLNRQLERVKNDQTTKTTKNWICWLKKSPRQRRKSYIRMMEEKEKYNSESLQWKRLLCWTSAMNPMWRINHRQMRKRGKARRHEAKMRILVLYRW